MWQIFNNSSLEEIFRFGVYVFLIYMIYWFIKKMWSLVEGKIESIFSNTLENKNILLRVDSIHEGQNKTLKDTAVILAQTFDSIKKHDKNSNENQAKIVAGIEKLCDNLNGGNPVVVKLRKEFKEFKESIIKEEQDIKDLQDNQKYEGTNIKDLRIKKKENK